MAMNGSRQRPWYLYIEDVLGTVALGTILIVMGAQIVLRYIFNDSLIWSDEISRYLLIALVFLGAATAVRQQEHIVINLIDGYISDRALEVLKRLVDVVLAAYLLAIIYHSHTVVMLFLSQPSSALHLPMGVPYATIPLGFALALWRLLGPYLNRLPRGHGVDR